MSFWIFFRSIATRPLMTALLTVDGVIFSARATAAQLIINFRFRGRPWHLDIYVLFFSFRNFISYISSPSISFRIFFRSAAAFPLITALLTVDGPIFSVRATSAQLIASFRTAI